MRLEVSIGLTSVTIIFRHWHDDYISYSHDGPADNIYYSHEDRADYMSYSHDGQ